jgi:hydrogenase-4 component B
LWTLLSTPVAGLGERSAAFVVRLQAGNLRIYLGWTLATLLVLLWIIS